MQANQQEEEELCSICLDNLPQVSSKFTRMVCCGKGLHTKCYDNIFKSSMSHKQKNQCIMCRTEHPSSDEETIEQLRPWVEKGKAWAQAMLGQRYYHGLGVDQSHQQSHQQAKELLELAANQGEATAQCNLGIMYANGQGVDQSYERAAEYYEAAARQGYASAQLNLGDRYMQTVKVSRNPLKERVSVVDESGRAR